jgi:hypothetical protein
MRLAAIITASLACSSLADAQCPREGVPFATHGKDSALVCSSASLKVDADGAPNSCRVNGKGLS